MKNILLLALSIAGLGFGRPVFASAGLWNRYDCFLGKNTGAWEKDGGHYSSNGFPIQMNEVITAPQMWMNIPDSTGSVYGVCSTMTGIQDPDSIRLEIFAWSATRIVDMQDCKAVGQNVKLVGTISRDIKRGENIKFLMPWSGQFTERMMIVRIPTLEELMDVETSFVNYCNSMVNESQGY